MPTEKSVNWFGVPIPIERARKVLLYGADDTPMIHLDEETMQVGIGTASPGSDLAVYSENTTTDLEVTAKSGGDNTSWRIRAHRGNNELYILDNVAGVIVVRIADGAPINSLVIDASGHVGLGTTTPGSALDIGAGAITGAEMTAPSAPVANGWVLYGEDNGAGKTRLMVKFNTGAAQQIAIQP